uniref:Capsid protein n=1 Tax=Angiostrongylus cantonensis TaxID=6313 RepID=A0A0K0DP52_ANGCA
MATSERNRRRAKRRPNRSEQSDRSRMGTARVRGLTDETVVDADQESGTESSIIKPESETPSESIGTE